MDHLFLHLFDDRYCSSDASLLWQYRLAPCHVSDPSQEFSFGCSAAFSLAFMSCMRWGGSWCAVITGSNLIASGWAGGAPSKTLPSSRAVPTSGRANGASSVEAKAADSGVAGGPSAGSSACSSRGSKRSSTHKATDCTAEGVQSWSPMFALICLRSHVLTVSVVSLRLPMSWWAISMRDVEDVHFDAAQRCSISSEHGKQNDGTKITGSVEKCSLEQELPIIKHTSQMCTGKCYFTLTDMHNSIQATCF